MENTMIRHVVVFTFKNDTTELEKTTFFEDSKKLTAVDGVKKFEILKQSSPKNKFEQGFSMEFDNDDLLQAYIISPINRDFVQRQWLKYVDDYMVLDYHPFAV